MSVISEMNLIRKRYGSALFRGGLTYAVNSLCYLLHMQPMRGPIYAGFDVTFRCNSKCTYCDRWKEGLKGKQELSTKEALKAIREVGKLGTWMMGFNGGEPLMRKDLPLLIKEAKKSGMIVDVNTNGLLLKTMAKTLVDSGVNTVTISVEGVCEEYHDKIRQTPGLFKKLNEGIIELKRVRGKKALPMIKVRTALSKDNYKEIEKYINHWEPMVDEVILQPIHEGNSNFFTMTNDMKFDNKDEVEFRKTWNELMKKHKWLSMESYREFPTFFFDKALLHKKYKCFAGTFYIQIDPYGNVQSCNDYTFTLGNLKEKSFKKIWGGKKAKGIRDILRKRKQKCVCWYNCNGTVNCYINKTIGKFDKKY